MEIQDKFLNTDDGKLQAKVDSLVSTSPLFQKYISNPVIEQSEEESPHGGHIEYLPPGETDPEGNILNPHNTDMFKFYDKAKNLSDDEKVNMIKGDFLHALRRDSKWDEMTNRVWDLRGPEAIKMDDGAYKGSGDKRDFDKWADVSRKDAWVRAYIMGYDNWKEVFDNAPPEQIKVLEEMKTYLETGK